MNSRRFAIESQIRHAGPGLDRRALRERISDRLVAIGEDPVTDQELEAILGPDPEESSIGIPLWSEGPMGAAWMAPDVACGQIGTDVVITES